MPWAGVKSHLGGQMQHRNGRPLPIAPQVMGLMALEYNRTGKDATGLGYNWVNGAQGKGLQV